MLEVRDLSVFERPIRSINGFAGLIGVAFLGLLILANAGSIDEDKEESPVVHVLMIILFSIGAVCLISGLRIINPNEAMVATFFGSYRGVLRTPGFRMIAPFQRTYNVSLRLQNFESPTVKVNDKGGCPVDVRAVIVWRVIDAAQATFHVFFDTFHIRKMFVSFF